MLNILKLEDHKLNRHDKAIDNTWINQDVFNMNTEVQAANVDIVLLLFYRYSNLFELSGVLWHSDKIIPGCPETVQKLKQMVTQGFIVLYFLYKCAMVHASLYYTPCFIF